MREVDILVQNHGTTTMNDFNSFYRPTDAPEVINIQKFPIFRYIL
jgi:hypothetical protein